MKPPRDIWAGICTGTDAPTPPADGATIGECVIDSPIFGPTGTRAVQESLNQTTAAPVLSLSVTFFLIETRASFCFRRYHMLFRNKLPLLTILLTVVVAYATAAPAPQAGQDIRITNGPVIEEATSNAAVVAWSTDVPSSSRVWYGTERNNLTHSAEAADNGSKTHRVRIYNLRPNTTYYFQVESSQRRGNRGEAESAGVRSFRTTASGAQPVRNQNVQLVENDRQAGDVAGGKVRITNGPVIEEVDRNHAQ